MFFRLSPRNKSGKTYRYLQLCESYRNEQGQPRVKVLCSLGNIEHFSPDELQRMAAVLHREAGLPLAPEGELQAGTWKHYGDVLAIQQMWDQYALTERLDRLTDSTHRSFRVAPVVKVGVLNRLLAPRSERATWEWHHRLYLPELDGQPLPLAHLYRALDALVKIQAPLEADLFGQVKHLFNQELDVVFYDLTSTYFEGQGPPNAAYGYSRDKRPDRKQIVIALLTEEQGLPLGFQLFPGNRADVSTLTAGLETLRDRFQLRRCIFVGDSGLFSAANVAALEQAGYPYLMAVRKRWLAEHAELAHVPLTEYQRLRDDLLAYEGPATEEGRAIVCFSEARCTEQQQIRSARLGRAQASLQTLRERVHQGRLRDANKIALRAGRYLADAKATRYFHLDIGPGCFDFRLDQELLDEEARWDGKYFLQTTVSGWSVDQVVDAYFTLQRVEEAFRDLKDYLRVRPVYHYREDRVRGHVFLAVLAYLLARSLELTLARAGCSITARRALDLLGEIHAVEMRLGPKQVLTLTQPSPQAEPLLHALNLAPLPRVLPPSTQTVPASPAGGQAAQPAAQE
jgi:hypothetical protein